MISYIFIKNLLNSLIEEKKILKKKGKKWHNSSFQIKTASS